jgi:hypothetical protein
MKEIITKHVIRSGENLVLKEFDNISSQCRMLVQTHARDAQIQQASPNASKDVKQSKSSMFGLGKVAKGMGSYIYGSSATTTQAKKEEHVVEASQEEQQQQ